jgi:lambda family phage tail tape measure protein
MADTTLTVDVDTRDAVKSIDGLKTAIAGLITGAAIKQLMDFSDGLTNINNRLRAMSGDMDTANKQFGAIAAIAMQTGSSLKDVADTFAKLTVSTRDLGISQQEVADITSTLTKQLAINGTSAVETGSAMYQFNQAMALGVFQGNDLHSLLQTMPAVMQGFADSIGQPVGNLKKLGETGSITSQMMIDYFRKIKDQTDVTFGGMGTTFARAFENVKTASSLAFNEFEKNTQTGQNLALSIEYIAFQIYKLSKNIDDIIGPLTTFAKIAVTLLAFTYVGRILEAVTGAVIAFVRVLFNLPAAIGAIGTKMTALVEYVGTAGATFQGLGRVLTPLLGVLASVTTWVGQLAAAFYAFTGLEKLSDWFKSLGNANSDSRKELEDFRAELKKNQTELDNTVNASKVAEEQQKKLAYALSLVSLASRQQTDDLKINLDRTREKLKADAEDIYLAGQLTNKSKDQIEVDKALRDLQFEKADAVRKLTQEQQKLQAELKNPAMLANAEEAKVIKGKIGIIGEQIKTEEKLYAQQKEALPAYIIQLQSAKMLEAARLKDTENMVKAVEDQIARQQTLGEQLKSINDQKVDLKFQTGEIGKSVLTQQLDKIKEDSRKAGLSAGRAFAESFGQDELTPERARELADGLALIKKGYDDISAAQLANLEQSRTWSAGWTEAYNKYYEDAYNSATNASQIFNTATKGMEDALVKFALTGKLSFTDLANSIIADIMRILVKRVILSSMGLGGDMFGGIFKAGGGSVNSGTPYVVGDAGPELFVPTSAGTIIPNNKLSDGGNSTNVVYNIQAVDASSFRSLVARDPQFIYNITEVGRKSTPSRRFA